MVRKTKLWAVRGARAMHEANHQCDLQFKDSTGDQAKCRQGVNYLAAALWPYKPRRKRR